MAKVKGNRPGEEAVQKATGKGWDEWFTLLDGDGCLKMKHPAIAKLLKNHYGVSAWWSQTVTVAYEYDRGLRELHERDDGFSIGRTRTVPLSLDQSWEALHDSALFKEWLPGYEFTITHEKPKQFIYADRPDGTKLTFAFDPKGDTKSVVTVAHTRLPSGDAAEEMKAFWSDKMDWLQTYLGSA